VGTTRQEVLDHLLILDRRHLEKVVKEFIEQYLSPDRMSQSP